MRSVLFGADPRVFCGGHKEVERRKESSAFDVLWKPRQRPVRRHSKHGGKLRPPSRHARGAVLKERNTGRASIGADHIQFLPSAFSSSSQAYLRCVEALSGGVLGPLYLAVVLSIDLLRR